MALDSNGTELNGDKRIQYEYQILTFNKFDIVYCQHDSSVNHKVGLSLKLNYVETKQYTEHVSVW